MEYFFDKKIKEASVIRVYFNDKILLLKRPFDDRTVSGWCLPGGKKEESESHLECAIRELFEESNLIANNIEYIGEYSSEMKEYIAKIHVYEMKVSKEEISKVKISDEHEGYQWATHEDFLQLNFAGRTLNAIRLKKEI